MKKPIVDYDDKKDVLYLTVKNIGKASDATAREISNGVFIHYEDKTRNIVGITMVGFSKLIQKRMSKVSRLGLEQPLKNK